MKFECGDMERALAVPDLMPDALIHAKTCPACRRELWLWNEISRMAGQLHQEWDSTDLWPKIRTSLAAEPKPVIGKRWQSWYWLTAPALAAAVLLIVFLHPAHRAEPPPSRAFLTEQALQEVETNEAAYMKSIDKLSVLAGQKLETTESPLAVSYREKLVLLDSAITDLKATLDGNRFNARLRTELASLYRDKQKTLEEILTHDDKN